ncbi:MAG: hypothetical protein MJZ17_06505 [Bacteroidales bacterium]|nr:hypothetical protein [Bacteroidales bacterium]
MSDYSGYEEALASKQVLKEFVAQGYGEKALYLYSSNLPWQNKMQSYVSEFASKTGFKEDLVKYVFECIEYGLGWIKDEPSYNQSGQKSAKKDYTEDLTGVDLDKQLILMQKEYISMLNSLIVVPEGRLYKKSGYYPAQAISELWVVEHKIDIISAALGQNNSAWCKSEKEKVLSQFQRTKSSQFGAVFAKVILPVLILLIGSTEGIKYFASSKELNEYNSYMASGEAALAKGNYADAIEAFVSAGEGYDGVFAPSSKKKAATTKLTEAITPLFNETVASAREMAAAGKYADARELLKGFEQYPFDNAMRSSLESEQKNLEDVIVNAVSDGKNTLLMTISTKGRKLDATTHETLNELLKVAPDDYWLNFVLNKSK